MGALRRASKQPELASHIKNHDNIKFDKTRMVSRILLSPTPTRLPKVGRRVSIRLPHSPNETVGILAYDSRGRTSLHANTTVCADREPLFLCSLFEGAY